MIKYPAIFLLYVLVYTRHVTTSYTTAYRKIYVVTYFFIKDATLHLS